MKHLFMKFSAASTAPPLSSVCSQTSTYEFPLMAETTYQTHIKQ